MLGPRSKALALTFLMVALCQVPALASADHAKLAQLFADDQRDRRDGPEETRCLFNGICDKERQVAALEIIRSGELRTANDFFHAATIFQHSRSPEDNALAHSLATIAAKIEPAHRGAKWLAAAAWDRMLMNRMMPQWYGTQITKRGIRDPWELYAIDEAAVTDEDRVRAGVPTLAETRERVRKMNAE